MAGFRKSLFGFNTDDVLAYIESTHKQFAQTEKSLYQNIDQLNETVNSLNEQLEAVISAKAAVEEELKKYTDKQAEIDKMTENIGKLYLVSQANAKAIMQNAEESKKIANDEILRNLNAIDAAHKSLESIKLGVAASSEEFKQRISILSELLSAAKEGINSRTKQSAKKINEFNDTVKKIN